MNQSQKMGAENSGEPFCIPAISRCHWAKTWYVIDKLPVHHRRKQRNIEQRSTHTLIAKYNGPQGGTQSTLVEPCENAQQEHLNPGPCLATVLQNVPPCRLLNNFKAFSGAKIYSL